MANTQIPLLGIELQAAGNLTNEYITLARMILSIKDKVNSDLLERMQLIENNLKLFAKTQQLTFPTNTFIQSEKYVHPPGISIDVILAVLATKIITIEDKIDKFSFHLSITQLPRAFVKSLCKVNS